VLGTVDFGGLGQNPSPALGHQQINRMTKRRVGGDARIPVRAATLQRHHELAGGRGRARNLIDAGQALADLGRGLVDGFPGPASALNGQALKTVSIVQIIFFAQIANLHHLAAQPDKKRRPNIWMGGMTPDHPFEIVKASA